MRTALLQFIAIGLTTGCNVSPDGKGEAHSYVTAIEPLVYENGLLAQALLQAAADVHGNNAAPVALTRWWHDDYAPLTEHLAHQAAAVSAPSDWSDSHAELVSIWEQRALAYRQLDTAITQGDADQWGEARTTADTAKIREEEWFRTVDGLLAPFGIALDQYP